MAQGESGISLTALASLHSVSVTHVGQLIRLAEKPGRIERLSSPLW
jgi:hypothetical protein